MLAKPPEAITVGEIVRVLEGGINLSSCIENPEVCGRASDCLTRGLWEETTKAMFEKLNSATLSKMINERSGS